MNYRQARGVLSEYVANVEKAQALSWPSKDRKAAMTEVAKSVRSVNFCLRELVPDIELISGNYIKDHVRALPRVRRALELLTNWEKLAGRGRPRDMVPAMLPIAMMDSAISSAAIPLWEAEQYRLAVNKAATAVNALAQDRLGRHDISDSDLMAQAFSVLEPQEGKPRLRCPGDHTSMTVRSMQQGALLMSQGVFQAIRNPAVHLDGDWNPVTAAEYLASLSVVARWVRHWTVIKYIAPSPDLNAIIAQYQKSVSQPSETSG